MYECVFFFKQKTAYEMRISDWSSDVCSSDLYDGFVVDKVARYGVRQRARLLADAGIIRNRLKVDSAIENAKRIVALRRDYGSFGGWIDAHHPLGTDEWVKLFRKPFKFMGGELGGAFLMSTGYLPGAHHEPSPAPQKYVKLY